MLATPTPHPPSIHSVWLSSNLGEADNILTLGKTSFQRHSLDQTAKFQPPRHYHLPIWQTGTTCSIYTVYAKALSQRIWNNTHKIKRRRKQNIQNTCKPSRNVASPHQVPEQSLCHVKQDSNKPGHVASNHISLEKKNGVWEAEARVGAPLHQATGSSWTVPLRDHTEGLAFVRWPSTRCSENFPLKAALFWLLSLFYNLKARTLFWVNCFTTNRN